jgi:hypothetical protein
MAKVSAIPNLAKPIIIAKRLIGSCVISHSISRYGVVVTLSWCSERILLVELSLADHSGQTIVARDKLAQLSHLG